MKRILFILLIGLAGCEATKRNDELSPSYMNKVKAACFKEEIYFDSRQVIIKDYYTSSCGTPKQKENFVKGNYFIISPAGDILHKGIPHPIVGI